MNANIITDSLQANEYASDWSVRFRRVGYQRMLVLRSQVNLYYFWEKRWFFLAMAIGALLISIEGPPNLSRDGYIVLVMSIVATILFITEPIPLPTVALLIIVGQVLLLDLDSTKVAKTLMTDSVLFIMGSLMLAVAVVKQQLDKRIAWYIVKMTGTKTVSICFGITVVSGILASFVGEHTVAAMMLPVGITLITLTSDNPKRVRNLAAVLLFSICYGCSVAGIGTPSGGARNAIMVGYWKEFFYDPTSPESFKYLMDYWQWMTYAYPLFLVQLPFVTLILFVTFKPEYKDLSRGVAKLRTQILMQGPLRPSAWLSIIFFRSDPLGVDHRFFRLGHGNRCRARRGRLSHCRAGALGRDQFRCQLGRRSALRGGYIARRREEDHRCRHMDRREFPCICWRRSASTVAWGSGPPFRSLTTSVTNTMSNGAAVAVLGPIVLKVAVVAGESPIVIGFITAVSSAFAYLTVVGTPACTIVYASGYLKTTDFLKVGWRMAIVSTAPAAGHGFRLLAISGELGMARKKPVNHQYQAEKEYEEIREKRRNRFRILACVDGTEESLMSVRFAAKIGWGKECDIIVAFVRPVDQGLRSGGLQVGIARQNMLDWGLDLPGVRYLKDSLEVLREEGQSPEDWSAKSAHQDTWGDPLGDNKVEYVHDSGKTVVLKTEDRTRCRERYSGSVRAWPLQPDDPRRAEPLARGVQISVRCRRCAKSIDARALLGAHRPQEPEQDRLSSYALTALRDAKMRCDAPPSWRGT